MPETVPISVIGWEAGIVLQRSNQQGMKMHQVVSLACCLSFLTFLTGCDDERSAQDRIANREDGGIYPEACGRPPKLFRTAEDGIDHHAIVNVVRLSDDNRFFWNRNNLTASELSENTARANQMSPTPYLVLEIATGTPCDYVTEVRSTLAATALCQSGACAEGQNWRDWPITRGPNH